MLARVFFVLMLLTALLGFNGRLAAEETPHNEAETSEAETNEAEAAAHDEHAHLEAGAKDPNPVEADVDLALWTLGIFVCLLLLLKKVAWGPIVTALEAREAGISGNIAAAAAKHEDAKKLLAEHQAKVDAAAEEVRGMLEEARRDAEATKTEIVAEAKRAADAERQRALREIDNAKDGAVKSLAEESAKLAIDLAAKVVKREITPERQSEYVREALGLMNADGAQNN